MKKKRGNKIYLVIVIILIFTIPLTYFLFIDKRSNPVKETFEKIFYPEPTSNNKNNPLTTNDNNQPSSGGGSSGGGEGGSQNVGGNSICKYHQISYSVSEVSLSNICNFYDNYGNCLDKTSACSVFIKNLDFEKSGVFEIEFLFTEGENDANNFFNSMNTSSIIEPKQSLLFNGVININNPEIANKDINCYYKTHKIPSKEICI